MKLSDAAAAAKTAGFTHVKTYGGHVSLDEWKPYGDLVDRVQFNVYPAEAVIRGWSDDQYRGRAHRITGCWPLLKEASHS